MTTKLRAASFQDGAVTSTKIAASAVTNAKLAGSIATAKLVQGSSFLTSVATSNLPAGTLLQYKTQKHDGVTTMTSQSFVDSGSSVAITPLSSSNIIIITAMLAAEVYGTANTGARYKLQRVIGGSATDVYETDYDLYHSSSDDQRIDRVIMHYIDGPGRTAGVEVTYKVVVSSSTVAGSARHNQYGSPSVITVYEVKG